MPAPFSIAYGREAEHATELKRGLEHLPDNFAASICLWCEGEGRRKSTYTAGCGRGYYSSMGGCDHCNGTGLLQGDKPAPSSVRNQVICAATQ